MTLGRAFNELRRRLGLSLEEAAAEIGEADFVLSAFEDDDGSAVGDEDLREAIHAAWDIDLYCYLLAFHSDERKTPEPLRAPVKALADGCRRHIESIINARKDQA